MPNDRLAHRWGWRPLWEILDPPLHRSHQVKESYTTGINMILHIVFTMFVDCRTVCKYARMPDVKTVFLHFWHVSRNLALSVCVTDSLTSCRERNVAREISFVVFRLYAGIGSFFFPISRNLSAFFQLD